MSHNADALPLFSFASIIAGTALILFAITGMANRHQLPEKEIIAAAQKIVTLADAKIPGPQSFTLSNRYQLNVDNTLADPYSSITVTSDNPTACTELVRPLMTTQGPVTNTNPFSAITIGKTRITNAQVMMQARIEGLCLSARHAKDPVTLALTYRR